MPATDQAVAKKRPSKSPARVGPPGRAAADSKSPASTAARQRRTKSPARAHPTPGTKEKTQNGKEEEETQQEEEQEGKGEGEGEGEETVDEEEDGKAKADADAPAEAKTTQEVKEAPAPAPKSAEAPLMSWLKLDKVFLLFVVVAFPLFLAMTGMPSTSPKKIKSKLKLTGSLSAKAFDGTKLLHTDGYRGSALVSFMDSSCAECKSLKRTIALAQKDPAFEGKLRFGQVDCSKHLELCTRFGVSGDDEGATGYPYVMWFRAGAEVGAYDGERSVEGLSVWTQEKEGQGLLFSYA